MEALHKFVPKDILPEEYGGNGGKTQDIIGNILFIFIFSFFNFIPAITFTECV